MCARKAGAIQPVGHRRGLAVAGRGAGIQSAHLDLWWGDVGELRYRKRAEGDHAGDRKLTIASRGRRIKTVEIIEAGPLSAGWGRRELRRHDDPSPDALLTLNHDALTRL